MSDPSEVEKRRTVFRKLHEKGTFLIPNPYDLGTAVILESLGSFPALATSSAGFAFTLGLPDGAAVLTLEPTLQHIRSIVQITSLPVNADFQNGLARTGDYSTLAHNVKLCAETGVAGLSIEDLAEDSQLYTLEEAVNRVKTARTALDQTAPNVLLTARCESFLIGVLDIDDVIKRLTAYSEAGADVLYAPNVYDIGYLERIVQAVAPKPVNVLVANGTSGLTVDSLASIGVRRISVGSALARVALSAFMRAAEEIAKKGSFETLGSGLPFSTLNNIFTQTSSNLRQKEEEKKKEYKST